MSLTRTLASSPLETQAESATQILQWAMSYKISDAIEAIIRMGVLDELIDSQKNINELASRLNVKVNYLQVLLDLGVRVGVLSVSNGLYQITNAAKTVIPLLKMEYKLRQWHQNHDSLYTTVKNGTPNDPMIQGTHRELYDEALSRFCRTLALCIKRIRILPESATILDLGGGNGALAIELLRINAAEQVVVVDRPYVENYFKKNIQGLPINKKIRFFGADLTDPSLIKHEIKSARVILLSNVVHLLSLEHRKIIWKTIKEYAFPGTLCLIYDQFLPERSRLETNAITPAEMLTLDWLRCGIVFDLTPQDMVSELKDCGFTVIDIATPAITNGNIIVSETRQNGV